MPDVTGHRWRGVLVYLALAFGLSWLAQIGLAVWSHSGSADAGLQALGGGMLIAALALMWPPAIGAFVARRWVEGNDFSDAGLRRGPIRYVLFGWLIPPLLVLGAMILSLPVYPFDPTFGSLRQMMAQSGAAPVPAEMIVLIQIVSGLTFGVLINSVFAFGEEFGWRGYLLPRLIRLLGWWPGVIGHGAIWGFWHAPLIGLTGYNYPGHPVIGVPLFVVFCALMGIIMAWLQLASGSVLPPTIAHASLNAVAGLPLILLTGVDAAIGGTLWSPIGWIALLLMIVLLWVSGALPRLQAAQPRSELRSESL